MAKITMKEWFKKHTWPIIRIGLPLGIVAGGAVFVVLAVINQWMDAGSARYLLSAIVQSLAALLAIIFAGVAVLLNREFQATEKLEALRLKYINYLKTRISQPDKSNVSFAELLRRDLKKIFLDAQPKQRNVFSVISELYHCSPLDIFSRISCLAKIVEPQTDESNREKDIERMAKEYRYRHEPIQHLQIEGKSCFYKLLYYPEDFFYTLERTGTYLSELLEKPVPKLIMDKFRIIYESMVADRTRYYRKIVVRGKRARGPWFKFLISLYSITIAGGMVLLSVLKGGSSLSDLSATWIAAGPLLFGICAVALTFMYLANIISGEKDE